MPTKPTRRDPKTARCWNDESEYSRVWNEHNGTWGYCSTCESVQGIVAPSLNKGVTNA